MRSAVAQGDSVRATWGLDEEVEKKPIRREPLRSEAAPPPARTDNALRLRLADEIDYARRMLAALGDELSMVAAVVAGVGSGVLSVVVVAQVLGHLAAVVRAEDAEQAVERIGMAELKARLKRRGGV
jgi:hypothetical protein